MIVNSKEGESYEEFMQRYRDAAELLGQPWYLHGLPEKDQEPYQDDPEDDE